MPELDENGNPIIAVATTPAVTPAPAARVLGHGGEIPEERVSEIKRDSAAKERKKLLRELYGTDDEDAVKKLIETQKTDVEEAKKLREEREKARLAELSESDRLKAELAKERADRAAEKETLTRERDTHKSALELERQDIQITGMASEYVAPKFLKTAKVEFGEYVEGLTKTAAAELDPAKIKKWFADYVKKNPEFAPPKPAVAKTAEELAAEAKAKAAANPPTKRAPIGAARGAGVRPAAPVARPISGNGTFKGKLVKDLTKAELGEYYKSKGMRKAY